MLGDARVESGRGRPLGWMAYRLRQEVWERARQAEIFRKKSPGTGASTCIAFHSETEEREAQMP